MEALTVAKVTIDITSEQADDLLFALKMRASQVKLNRDPGREELRMKINSACEEVFGWDRYPGRHEADDSIRVTITTENRW